MSELDDLLSTRITRNDLRARIYNAVGELFREDRVPEPGEIQDVLDRQPEHILLTDVRRMSGKLVLWMHILQPLPQQYAVMSYTLGGAE